MNDLATHFARLFALLESARERHEYDSPAVLGAAAAGAVSARGAGVLPEHLMAWLRRQLLAMPLADVGDWFRGVLVERLVSRAIQAYYRAGGGGPAGGAAPGDDAGHAPPPNGR